MKLSVFHFVRTKRPRDFTKSLVGSDCALFVCLSAFFSLCLDIWPRVLVGSDKCSCLSACPVLSSPPASHTLSLDIAAGQYTRCHRHRKKEKLLWSNWTTKILTNNKTMTTTTITTCPLHPRPIHYPRTQDTDIEINQRTYNNNKMSQNQKQKIMIIIINIKQQGFQNISS